MARARGTVIDRTLALLVAVAVHVVLVCTWLSLSRDTDPIARSNDALQVVWIERPLPVAMPVPPTDTAPLPATKTSGTRRAIESAATSRPSAAPAAAPATEPLAGRPLSWVFVEQGRALAEAQHGHDFVRNPLVDRQAVRIDVSPERFRMRDPMTPAKVVAAIGILFGGAGYETDPCPRIHRNLGHLITAGRDDPALQEELRRHQRFCRQ